MDILWVQCVTLHYQNTIGLTFSSQEFYFTGHEFLALWVSYGSEVRVSPNHRYYVRISAM